MGKFLIDVFDFSEAAVNVLCSGGRVSMAINRCRKPTIAAIQGPAVGVIDITSFKRFPSLTLRQIGITMTLPMTIRIAYEKAKVGFVFSQRGVVMEAASSFFLPRLIGHSKALSDLHSW